MITLIKNLILKNYYRRQLNIHNNLLFSNIKLNKKNIVLIELNHWSYLHIIKSYLSFVLSKKYDAQLVAFESYTLISEKINKSYYKILLRNLMIFFSFGTYGIYKSFGVKKFIYPKIKKKDDVSNEIINYYLHKINSTSDLMKMKIYDIYIGDLIYDTYLKIYKLPTIDTNADSFKIFLKDSIILFLWWHEYFKKNKKKIKSLITVHSVYLFGLQARICNYFNIKVYKPSHKSIMEVSRKHSNHANDAFLNIKHIKNIKDKNIIYEYSRKEIQQIVDGKSSVGKNYSHKIKNRLDIKNKNHSLTILIVCHSFLDAPHSFGKFFKNDFYEWLCVLGEISNLTNYTWLIKPHPMTYDNDKFFLKKILKKYPKFKIVQKKYKNQEILSSGIDFALTCFGTISFEYTYLGIKVINFTKNHPFKNFKFSFTPKSLKHYINILLNLDKFNYYFDKKKILEYYYIKRFVLNVDYMEFKLDPLKDMNGYHLKDHIFKESFYNKWIKDWSLNKHIRIIKNIENFVNSQEPFMSIYNIKNVE